MESGKAWQEARPLLQRFIDAFNSEPMETRRHYQPMEIQVRLQHLQFERQRLKKAYDASLADIRSHEANLLSSLRRLADGRDP